MAKKAAKKAKEEEINFGFRILIETKPIFFIL